MTRSRQANTTTLDVVGTMLGGRYNILRLIGSGGLGAVALARDIRMGREVAVKMLRSIALGNPEAEARFQREAQALAMLKHPNLVDVYDIGEEDGAAFIVMEYVQGRTLAQEMNGGPVLVPRMLQIALQIARGLMAAHEKGVVHRDLKPENIMLSHHEGQPDHVKVLDFGIAKLARDTGAAVTFAGAVFGTPHYMAPEQASGDAGVDHRADIYALGTMMYEMTTGVLPFNAETMQEHLMMRIVMDPIPIRDRVTDCCSADVEALIMKCLERALEKRVQTMADFAKSIEHLLGVEAQTSVPVDHSPENASIATIRETSLSSTLGTGKATTHPRIALIAFVVLVFAVVASLSFTLMPRPAQAPIPVQLSASVPIPFSASLPTSASAPIQPTPPIVTVATAEPVVVPPKIKAIVKPTPRPKNPPQRILNPFD